MDPSTTSEPRRRSIMVRFARMAAVLAILYLGACVLLVAFEGSLLFHPTRIPAAVAERLGARPGVEPLAISAHDGVTLRGFFVAGAAEEPRATLIYFGGNAEAVWGRVDGEPGAHEGALNRVYVSYRGYDGSGGSPTADALSRDALTIYDHVAARDDVRGDAIVAWGTSLGTGLAIHLARERRVAGVILLAPYDRLSDVAADHYPFAPVRLLMRNDIDSVSKAAVIRAPALIVHGTADRVIPILHGRALARRWAGSTELLFLPDVGHDVEASAETHAAVDAFIGRIAPHEDRTPTRGRAAGSTR